MKIVNRKVLCTGRNNASTLEPENTIRQYGRLFKVNKDEYHGSGVAKLYNP